MDEELTGIQKEETGYAQKVAKKYAKLLDILERMIDLSKFDLNSPDTTSHINYKIVSIFSKYPSIYKEKDDKLKQKYIIANALRESLLENYKRKREKSPPTSD